MTGTRPERKKGHSKRRLRKNLNEVRVVIPITIFVFSIFLFYLVIQEPINLAISLTFYIVTVLSLMWYAKNFYGKKRFLAIWKVVLHPIFGLVGLLAILVICFKVNFFSSFTSTACLIWIFSSALFSSFVAREWLHSLRNGKYPFQTAQIYLRTLKFKWYLHFSISTIILMSILAIVYPLLSPVEFLFGVVFFVFVAYYFLFLFFARFGFLLVGNDSRKYCEIGLNEVKKGLEDCSIGGFDKRKIFIKNYLPIFTTVVDKFNELFKKQYPELSPNLQDSNLYTKALFASAIRDKPCLLDSIVGIDLMNAALNIGKMEKSIDFIGFIGGLCLIEGKEPKFSNIPESIEIKPSLEKSLSKTLSFPVLIAVIGILIALVSIYCTFLVGAPEIGYRFTNSVFGEGFAKRLFPIGEAQITLQQGYVELLPSTTNGLSTLKGEAFGEYSFNIRNDHYKNMEIENIDIMGPTSITSIGLNVPDNAKELIKVKWTSSTIIYPADKIIPFDNSENVTLTIHVDYDLSELEPYLKNIPSNEDLRVYGGGVQMTLSYGVGRTGLIITKNTILDNNDNFGFFFSPTLFENSKIS
jgi:hypothetical protein